MKRTGKFKKKRIVTTRSYVKDCVFCKESKNPSYKNYEILRSFVSDRARIKGRVYTGLCNKHQKMISVAVKRGRFLGLLPYVPM